MEKKNELLKEKINAKIMSVKADFCWVFMPNGDFIHFQDERQYSFLLYSTYESRSNQSL